MNKTLGPVGDAGAAEEGQDNSGQTPPPAPSPDAPDPHPGEARRRAAQAPPCPQPGEPAVFALSPALQATSGATFIGKGGIPRGTQPRPPSPESGPTASCFSVDRQLRLGEFEY